MARVRSRRLSAPGTRAESDGSRRHSSSGMDDIMLGRVRYPALRFQLDTGGKYEELPDAESTEATEQTLAYRKVQGLEADPLMLELIQRPCSANLRLGTTATRRRLDLPRDDDEQARRQGHAPAVASGRRRRVETRSRSAGDDLDRARRATPMNGCIQAIPGSHRLGPVQQERQHAERRRRRPLLSRIERSCISTFGRAKRCCCTTG